MQELVNADVYRLSRRQRSIRNRVRSGPVGPRFRCDDNYTLAVGGVNMHAPVCVYVSLFVLFIDVVAHMVMSR